MLCQLCRKKDPNPISWLVRDLATFFLRMACLWGCSSSLTRLGFSSTRLPTLYCKIKGSAFPPNNFPLPHWPGPLHPTAASYSHPFLGIGFSCLPLILELQHAAVDHWDGILYPISLHQFLSSPSASSPPPDRSFPSSVWAVVLCLWY
jgi:hypothetical protein